MNSILVVSLTLLLTVAAAPRPNDNTADALKTYFDISLGRGLYANFDDVVSLNATSIEPALNSGKSWMVEFYNSWCGHCINFAPTWKKLALNIKGWSALVRVGAVDCSHPANTALCRRYEVMSYPTVRYFPPQLPHSDFLGDDLFERQLDLLVAETARELSQRNDLRNVLNFRNNSKINWSSVSNQIERIVQVVNVPVLGQELTLDLRNISSIEVFNSIEPGSPTDVIVWNRPGQDGLERVQVVQQDFNRSSVLPRLCDVLCSKGYAIPKLADLSIIKKQNIDVTAAVALKALASEIKDKLKQHHAANVVFQVDIEGALKHSLHVEIPVHKTISGEALTALQNYIKVLVKYFHIGDNGKRMLNCIDSHLSVNSIGGEEFLNLTEKCENQNKPVYQVTNLGWVGCRGSSPEFRGFPCSMWTNFHALTVQQYLKKTGSPREVLDGIAGYVKHFLGCTYCSQHFQKMAKTIESNVTDGPSGLLWLWSSHNKVNARLAGDLTEDPSFPKIQYPDKSHCSECRFPNGTWNLDKVVEYLVRVYDSFTYMTLEDIDPELVPTSQDKTSHSNALRHEYLVDDVKYSEQVVDDSQSAFFALGFGVFDFSLCLVLYVFSMGIIALVCVKIIKNRKSSFKKKGSLLESFMKV